MLTHPEIVTPEAWEAARLHLREKEKELMRAGDGLAAERRRMPWTPVETEYRFDGPDGTVDLLDLFDGRRQLILYRAFIDPGVAGWPDHGCVGCSFMADHVPNLSHLNARDTTLVFVSRASQSDLRPIIDRMGWSHIPWFSMLDDFDADFGVDQWHGTNYFIRGEDDRVFRTYSTSGRGDEVTANTWTYLDNTALGRQETWEDSPDGYPQTPPYIWWKWNDAYDQAVSEEHIEQTRRVLGERAG
jgi:predicted dithiol-disulfide oxidoreductase (DUF899 family)